MRILIGLALFAASVAVSPASANGVTPPMRLTNSSGAAAATTNAAHRTTLDQAETRSQTRRENTYRAYYHRKFGTNPTDQQVRTWYARTYQRQPS
jgi:hypothetical protein